MRTVLLLGFMLVAYAIRPEAVVVGDYTKWLFVICMFMDFIDFVRGK